MDVAIGSISLPAGCDRQESKSFRKASVTRPLPPPGRQPAFGFPKSDHDRVEEAADAEGNVVVRREYPTVLGNAQWSQHNASVRSRFASIPPTDIKRIAVKRTMGMGDVILAEPAVRALQERFPAAAIDFFVGEAPGATEAARLFSTRPNVIPMAGMGEAPIFQDYLYDQRGYDLRFDLDLAYESRRYARYVDAYLDVLGFEDALPDKDGAPMIDRSVPDAERAPRLSCTPAKRKIPDRYASVTLEGSGWPGKEWGVEKWGVLLTGIQRMGYQLAFTSAEKVPTGLANVIVNAEMDFHAMLNFLYYADFHVGADNGPMHLAAAFGKPCFIPCGAALTRFTTPSRWVYGVSRPGLGCLHCKGRQFYNDNGYGGITFVPRCENRDPYACMTDLDLAYVESEFAEFRRKFAIA